MTPEATRDGGIPLPVHAITGDRVHAGITAAVARYLGEQQFDTSAVERVGMHMCEWLDNAKPGAPFVEVRYDNDVCLFRFRHAGVLRTPLYSSEDRPDVVEWLYDSYDDTGAHSILRGSCSAQMLVLQHHQPEAPSLLMFGEEQVREVMAYFGGQLTTEDTTPQSIEKELDLLITYRNSQLPFEYFGLDEEQKAAYCNKLFEVFTLARPEYNHHRVFAALSWLANITTEDERNTLLDAIDDQRAGLLPLENGEHLSLIGTDNTRIRYLAVPNLVESVTMEGVESKEPHAQLWGSSKQMHYFGQLYARRAQQEAQREQPDDVLLPELTVTEPPEPRDIAIFCTTYPNSGAIAEDIQYLRALRSAGYGVTLAVERDRERMYRGVRHLCDYAMEVESDVERLAAFDAMEFLFNMQREEQRDELYHLLCQRFAISVPVDDKLSPNRHIGIAAAIGQRMPHPPTGPDGQPLKGRARTAAVLATMYEHKLRLQLRKQLRSYDPNTV